MLYVLIAVSVTAALTLAGLVYLLHILGHFMDGF